MLSRVKQWLVEHAGLDPELLQRDWLDRVIQRRLKQLEVPSEDHYCRWLERDPAERDRIIREVSVGETCFFRYPVSYDLLVQHLRRLRETSGRRSALRMLSVACATGEEPYSMVISAVQAGWPVPAVSVDAVDRNADTLAVAREGRYSLHRSRPQLPAWTAPWLRAEDNQLCVAPPIRAAVHFHCADAVAAPESVPVGPYAIVFCRNLLIYLHDEARRRLVDNLAHWLEPEGLLFVGHAEQLESLRSRFRMVPHPGAFALRPAEAASKNAPAQPVVRLPSWRGPMGSDRSSRRGTGRASGARQVGDAPGEGRVARQPPTDVFLTDVSLLERARMAADQGRLETALTDIQAALPSSPFSADLYQLLGSIQLSQGRLPEARDALRRAVYLNPDHEQSLLQLAIVYQRLGDDAHAARYRKRAARAHQREAGGAEL
jgi:chemotaxis protein methyltransferase WspC